MTLIYGTGFELYGNYTNAQTDGWATFVANAPGSNETISIDTSSGRAGGACLSLVDASNANGATGTRRTVGTLGSSGTHTFIGVAYNCVQASKVGTILTVQDSGTTQVDLRHNADGSLTVTRNGTSLGSTGAGVLVVNTYNYFEMDIVIAGGTSGSVTVRKNGSALLSISGVNTQATANQSWNQIGLGNTSTLASVSSTQLWDDLYVCDANGSVNNTFLGDISVRGLLPTAAGSNSGLSRTGGSASGNYTAVNEKPYDSDTSYVSAGVLNTEDTYLFPSLPTNTSAVLGVMSHPAARKDDSGNRHISTRYRHSNGAEADFGATDMTLTSNYLYLVQVQETNPVTAVAWTTSDLSSGEFGPKISV